MCDNSVDVLIATVQKPRRNRLQLPPDETTESLRAQESSLGIQQSTGMLYGVLTIKSSIPQIAHRQLSVEPFN